MITVGWRFPPLSGGTRQGYTNNDIEAFKGEELIDNLAREICQNSLDAKDTSIADPVKVVFELKHIQKEHALWHHRSLGCGGYRFYSRQRETHRWSSNTLLHRSRH